MNGMSQFMRGGLNLIIQFDEAVEHLVAGFVSILTGEFLSLPHEFFKALFK
jgi:hypothetical protein